MSKKHRLQVRSSEQGSSGFTAFGLSSAEKDYRLAYFIGKELQIKLEKKETSGVFQWEDEQQRRKLRFFSNRQVEGLLLPQLREADYFALAYCLGEDNFAEEVRSGLSGLTVIQSLFPVPLKYEKSLRSLMEDGN